MKSTGTIARKKKEPTVPGQPTLSLSKKLVFSLIALVFSFALLESGLALLGVRTERTEHDPYAGFSSDYPLFVEEAEAGGQTFMTTARNRLDFFNPQRFPKIKAPGTFRLFSLGGSTTYGHPYSDPTSFNGWLRELLRATAPQQHWEAINAGGISYGSARVLGLMPELVKYHPDLFVVYCGQNEFLERQLAARIPERNRFARLSLDLASRSRCATLLKRLLTPRSSSAVSPSQPDPTVEREPVTLLDNRLGPTAYTRDDALRSLTFEQYRANLKRMITIARSAGARIVFVIPASNLRDVSPFKSQLGEGVNETNRARWVNYIARRARTTPIRLRQTAWPRWRKLLPSTTAPPACTSYAPVSWKSSDSLRKPRQRMSGPGTRTFARCGRQPPLGKS